MVVEFILFGVGSFLFGFSLGYVLYDYKQSNECIDCIKTRSDFFNREAIFEVLADEEK